MRPFVKIIWPVLIVGWLQFCWIALLYVQIERQDGGWIDAVPIPNTVLVNVADLMQRWTCGKLISSVRNGNVSNGEVHKDKQICRSSSLSGRNFRWPRRMLPSGESRWVCRRDRQTFERTPDRYITLSARRGQRYNLSTSQNCLIQWRILWALASAALSKSSAKNVT